MLTHTGCSCNLSDLCGVKTQPAQITRILVIDEIPLLSVGLNEVFRSMNPDIQLEYTDSIFRALSSREYKNREFHLIVLGSDDERASGNLLVHATGLKERFPGCRVMIFTDEYSPDLIAQTTGELVDACIHKHEPIEEIRNTYTQLSQGKCYVSAIFETLYHSYRLDR